MGNKIAPIKKHYSDTINTIDQQLDKHGYTRYPGTTETYLPFKELSGKYRTGLDEKAPYLNRLAPADKEAEIKRIRETKQRLEDALSVPGLLDPTSPFWNFASSDATLQKRFGNVLRVTPIKLGNDDKFFAADDVMSEINWNWIKVHPRIAPSLDAYKRGEVPSDTKYYIVDDEAEARDTYSRKKQINRAVIMLDEMTPTRRQQMARLMGLAVMENTPEENVYNLIDNQLKESEFREGQYKGMSPVSLFLELANTSDARIKVRDMVEQAITHSIYRLGQGSKILEGGVTIATSRDELVEMLLDEKNQLDFIALEKKLTNKKIERA